MILSSIALELAPRNQCGHTKFFLKAAASVCNIPFNIVSPRPISNHCDVIKILIKRFEVIDCWKGPVIGWLEKRNLVHEYADACVEERSRTKASGRAWKTKLELQLYNIIWDGT